MNAVATAMAKLAGVRKSLAASLAENVSRNRGAGEVKTRATFAPDVVKHYFSQAAASLELLRGQLPALYADFQVIDSPPGVEMASTPPELHYSRSQVERLARDIDQIFEIRANSELAHPQSSEQPRRVFISHGRSNDWRAVQSFLEKDAGLKTLELAQEANLGRTVIEKLFDNAASCDSAVIVMTGDDVANGDEKRVRENVMHEIGFFQGSYGRSRVMLLHEEGVNVPSNLSGLVYVAFPKGLIDAAFVVLQRDLRAIYEK